MTPRLALLAAAVLACAPNQTPVTKKGYPGNPQLGAPFTASEAPPGVWSWIDFPDTFCADGTHTGLGVNPGTGPDLLVFFDGGGACWDYVTCEVAGTAVDRNYGPAKFDADLTGFFPGSVMDRAALPAILSDATLVFVPYCTGDVHGGDYVNTYYGYGGLDSATWNHVGHANVMAFLRRLGASWSPPGKLVVAGSSAGGFGALAEYEAFRWYWPHAQGYLVDDSGPPLVGTDVDPSELAAWYNAWHLGVSLDPFCVDCRDDLSLAIASYASDYRGDRIAFLSHVQDGIMGPFLLKTPSQFEAALGRLLAARFTGVANAKVFYESGTDHMLLTSVNPGATGYLASQVTNGVALPDWLGLMVSDDPGWGNETP
jgi:hypothetical protein